MEVAIGKSQGVFKVLVGLWSFISPGPGVSTTQACASFCSWKILPLASVLYFSITVSQVSFVRFQWRENAQGRLDCPLSYKEWNSWLQWITAFIEENCLFALLSTRGINVNVTTHTQFSLTHTHAKCLVCKKWTKLRMCHTEEGFSSLN